MSYQIDTLREAVAAADTLLATITERAETPDAPPQTETLWPENTDPQGD